MELGFALFVLLELGSHFFSDLFLLELHLLDYGVIILLLCRVFLLNISHFRADSTELLDARRQLRLLLLHLLFNLLDELGQFLQ